MTRIDLLSEQILTDAAALALGALEEEEALAVCREIEQSLEGVIKEYQDMVWTTHHLPAALPLVSPPARLKSDILQAIRETNSDNQPIGHRPLTPEYLPEPKRDGNGCYLVRDSDIEWFAYPVPGIVVAPLDKDVERGYATLLMRLEPGSVFPSHTHSGAEHCFVVAGEICVGKNQELTAGSFFSVQAGADHGDIATRHGATVLLTLPLEEYKKSSWKVLAFAAKQKLRAVFGREK